MRRPLALLLGLAAACTDRPVGEDTDATSTTAATTSTSSTTSELPTTGASEDGSSTTDEAVECLEFSYRGDDPSPAWMLTCGLPELCAGDERPVFSIGSGELLDPGSVEVDDLERARCMAAALRDRTPGQIAWYVVAGVDVIRSPLSLEIVGATAIVRSVRYPGELSEPGSDNVYEGIYPLREPEFFAACVEGDALAVYTCLVDAVVPECLPAPLACPG